MRARFFLRAIFICGGETKQNMIKFSDIVNVINVDEYTLEGKKLVYYLNNIYRRMINQLRFSLAKLNGITTVETNRLFSLTGLEPEHFTDVINEYPKDVYMMKQPIYNLLCAIMLRAFLDGNERLGKDVNALLGLVILARRKFHSFKFIADQNIFDKTINTMSKKTYIGMHGIIWMTNTVSENTLNKYLKDMLKNPNNMYPRYRYINDLFNKYNQIIKTVAKHFYENYENRNVVDRSTMLKNRTNEVMNYLLDKPIPSNILEYISNICNMPIDKVNSFYHNVQIYNSMQSQIQLIIYNILDRLLMFLEIYHQQNNAPLDINDPSFASSFINKLKRSTIMLNMISNPIFTQYGYDRFEVLYFTFIITLYIDSLLHNSEYYGVADDNMEDRYKNSYNDYDNGNSNSNVDYYTENMEMLFDGVILNEELIDWGLGG